MPVAVTHLSLAWGLSRSKDSNSVIKATGVRKLPQKKCQPVRDLMDGVFRDSRESILGDRIIVSEFGKEEYESKPVMIRNIPSKMVQPGAAIDVSGIGHGKVFSTIRTSIGENLLSYMQTRRAEDSQTNTFRDSEFPAEKSDRCAAG